MQKELVIQMSKNINTEVEKLATALDVPKDKLYDALHTQAVVTGYTKLAVVLLVLAMLVVIFLFFIKLLRNDVDEVASIIGGVVFVWAIVTVAVISMNTDEILTSLFNTDLYILKYGIKGLLPSEVWSDWV